MGQERNFEFAGDRLTPRTPPTMIDGVEQTAIAILAAREFLNNSVYPPINFGSSLALDFVHAGPICVPPGGDSRTALS